jgi:hypothetical protein
MNLLEPQLVASRRARRRDMCLRLGLNPDTASARDYVSFQMQNAAVGRHGVGGNANAMNGVTEGDIADAMLEFIADADEPLEHREEMKLALQQTLDAAL